MELSNYQRLVLLMLGYILKIVACAFVGGSIQLRRPRPQQVLDLLRDVNKLIGAEKDLL